MHLGFRAEYILLVSGFGSRRDGKVRYPAYLFRIGFGNDRNFPFI